MKKAWIENGRIRDVSPGNPSELYHPDIAAHYSENVPDEAANGDGWDGAVLTKPEPPAPVAPEPVVPVPPKLSPVEFKLCFTPAERIAIKAARATDAVLDDAFDLLDDPRLQVVDLSLQSTQGLLDHCVTQGLLSADRAAQIKAGNFF